MTTDGVFAPDFADEIVTGCCVTHGSDVRHAPTAQLLDPQEGVAP
jgi:NAD(P) transhydrogenase subunit alpha